MEELRHYSGGARRTDVTFDNNNYRSFYEPSVRIEENTKVTNPYSSKSHGKWWNDPEAKRLRRVAKYKLYTTEDKFKNSLKRGFRWLKIKCIRIVAM